MVALIMTSEINRRCGQQYDFYIHFTRWIKRYGLFKMFRRTVPSIHDPKDPGE
jgi:hypothetical protein